MGAIRWIELDSLDNTSIAAVTAVGSYTCDADRMVFATLYAQGLAGGGDYIYYVTVTPNGLSEGEGLKTTQTLGATTYVLFAQTIGVALRNGDVMKVYLDGLGGDTATPDIRVNFYEDGALAPTTAGRTLDIASSGEAGLDFSNINAAANPTTLTNITVPTVTTTGAVTTLNGIANDVITAASINTGALTADAFAADAIVAATLATGALTADAFAADSIVAGSVKGDAVTKIAAGVLAVALTESYAADGAAPTLTQAVLAIQQFLQERSVLTTTMTVKKLDGSATAMTFTLNDATAPTAITRTT
jgi:hypothetical protein